MTQHKSAHAPAHATPPAASAVLGDSLGSSGGAWRFSEVSSIRGGKTGWTPAAGGRFPTGAGSVGESVSSCGLVREAGRRMMKWAPLAGRSPPRACCRRGS